MVWRIGHRGFAARAPENTLASFRLALETGVDAVECDVRLTADGVPVLLHDPTLDRTTDGHGPVEAYTFDEVRRLDAGGWKDSAHRGERIPTIEELLALVRGRATCCIELKAPGTPRPVIDAVRAAGMAEAVILFSFYPELLAEAAVLAPEIARLHLFAALPSDTPVPDVWWAGVHAVGATYVGVNKEALTADRVAAFHAAGVRVFSYTVNDEPSMRALLAMGVEGIISDEAALLLTVTGA